VCIAPGSHWLCVSIRIKECSSPSGRSCPARSGCDIQNPGRAKLPLRRWVVIRRIIKGIFYLFLLFFVFVFLVGIFSSREDQTKERAPSKAISTAKRTEEDAKRREWLRINALIVNAQDSVKRLLKDPDSAKFRNIFVNKSKKGFTVVCGEVNAKNSFGGYTGFQRFISGGTPDTTFLEESVADFPNAWNMLCVQGQRVKL